MPHTLPSVGLIRDSVSGQPPRLVATSVTDPAFVTPFAREDDVC
jgi:hypothetical protein